MDILQVNPPLTQPTPDPSWEGKSEVGSNILGGRLLLTTKSEDRAYFVINYSLFIDKVLS
jgi:hypothetical protein